MSKRLDVFLVEKGYAKSRERAKEIIKDGKVFINSKVVTKPSVTVDKNNLVEVKGKTFGYVGRGALKLLTAFECFDLDIQGKCCADMGASTGGFTQVMLEKGAKKVYAVDVGHGQLAQELINDSRVENCEGINVRNLTADFFDEPVEFISGDLSFISLKLVMPVLTKCIADGGEMIMLIKPQFEAGKQALNKKGIVRDKKDHVRVLREISECFKSCGLCLSGLEVSAIQGGDGNIEYLAHLKKTDDMTDFMNIDVKTFVESAFERFK